MLARGPATADGRKRHLRKTCGEEQFASSPWVPAGALAVFRLSSLNGALQGAISRAEQAKRGTEDQQVDRHRCRPPVDSRLAMLGGPPRPEADVGGSNGSATTRQAGLRSRARQQSPRAHRARGYCGGQPVRCRSGWQQVPVDGEQGDVVGGLVDADGRHDHAADGFGRRGLNGVA